ncbi:hypothetical protein DM50_4054 [Burkholderia mallei]|nr:hypothetical protein DM75_4058 [Burkholderia mallei]KOT02881.1 hypothetical protein DM50_4054 [Burkholderia mallei]
MAIKKRQVPASIKSYACRRMRTYTAFGGILPCSNPMRARAFVSNRYPL